MVRSVEMLELSQAAMVAIWATPLVILSETVTFREHRGVCTRLYRHYSAVEGKMRPHTDTI